MSQTYLTYCVYEGVGSIVLYGSVKGEEEGERDGGRERVREIEWERERDTERVCVCVRERERGFCMFVSYGAFRIHVTVCMKKDLLSCTYMYGCVK